MANYYPSPDFSAATISTTGAGHIGGDFDVATTKFTIAAASGNTAVAGTLAVTGAVTAASTANVAGDFSVATNKMTVASATGNSAIAGTLGVTGALTASSTANVVGDFSVATNKFTVTASSGNTAVAGTLAVTGTSSLAAVNISGNVAVATSKFTVASATGNTVVAGTLGVTGVTTLTGTLVAGAITASDTITASAVLSVTNQLRYSAVSPTALSGDTTDWAPASVATPILRIDGGAADRLLYSINTGAGTQFIWLVNIGAHNISLVHDNGSTGTATVRFLCPNSVNQVLYPNSSVAIWYDTTSTRWRVIGAQASGGVI